MKHFTDERLFICGIGTGVGKTVISAMLVSGLKADYWKPIQCGIEDGTDTLFVRSMVRNFPVKVHSESYLLESPMSPHAAARLEEIDINPQKLTPPNTSNKLIIEGVGGLHVPLSDKLLMSDVLAGWKVPVVLVSQIYLGSINHTLLTVEALKTRMIPIRGIIFNGLRNVETENAILNFTKLPLLGHVPFVDKVTSEFIESEGQRLASKLV